MVSSAPWTEVRHKQVGPGDVSTQVLWNWEQVTAEAHKASLISLDRCRGRLDCGLRIDGVSVSDPTISHRWDEVSARTARQPEGVRDLGVTRDGSRGAAASFPPGHTTRTGAPSGPHREAAGGEAADSSLVPGSWLASLTPTACPFQSSADLEQKRSPECAPTPPKPWDPSPSLMREPPVHSFYCCMIFHRKDVSQITHFIAVLQYIVRIYHVSFVYSPLNGSVVVYRCLLL